MNKSSLSVSGDRAESMLMVPPDESIERGRPARRAAAVKRAQIIDDDYDGDDGDDFIDDDNASSGQVDSENSFSGNEVAESENSVNDDSECSDDNQSKDGSAPYSEAPSKAKKPKATLPKSAKTTKAPKPGKSIAKPKVSTKDTSNSDAPKRVLEYMLQKNRPYSAAVLVPNLGNIIALSKMKKILDEGVVSGQLAECGEGSKVYFPNQSVVSTFEDGEQSRLIQTINDLETAVREATIVKEAKIKTNAAIEAQPDDRTIDTILVQLPEGIAKGEKELDQYLTKMKAFRLNESPAKLFDTKAEFTFFQKELKARQSLVIAGLKSAADVADKDWKDVANEAGVDIE